jgi:small subunit ribosomal protein S3
MKVRNYFIKQSMIRTMIDEYLAKQFYRAEYAGVDVQKTPIGTRVIIHAERPAIIIGRQGATIKRLSQILEKQFGLENPQITVTNVENPELNARIMAYRLVVALEKGYHFRRAAFITLRRIMGAGALGAEVIVSGKLTSERAKYEKIKEGKVFKTGYHLDVVVDRAVAYANLKPGIFGVEIIIAKPLQPADYMRIRGEEELKQIELAKQPGESSVTITNVRFEDEDKRTS